MAVTGRYRRIGDLGRRTSFVADWMSFFGPVFQECRGPLWVDCR
jgi:hypothetical protein